MPTARLTVIGLSLITVLILLRPVSSPDLWWHLARGRTAVAGAIAPSAQLLTLDHAAEADWLGGVPFYLLWSQTGVFGLACWPLLAGLLTAAWFGRRLPTEAIPLFACWLWPLACWCLRDRLQPTPAMFDLVGLIALGGMLPRPRAWWTVALLFGLWANLATQPVWGLILLAVSGVRWPVWLAAIGGGSLTPRGLFTWSDAFVLFAPRLSAGPGDELDPRWLGLLDRLDPPAITFLLLWAAWAVTRWRRSLQSVAVVAIPLLAVLVCRDHVALAALWMLLTWLAAPSPVLKSVWAVVAGSLIAVAALGDAAGMWPGSSRWGAGVAQEIDPRLLDLGPLSVDEAHSRGWAPDARSVGVVAWLNQGVQMVDHPQRALLAGRWPEHAALIRDFRGAHRAAYRRDDGEWGGIVQRLQQWDVSLLFLPVEDVALNQSLTDTPWRPVDLDSPTVPYVSTDDAYFGRVIVEVMQQEDFVELGAWQPSLEVYDGQGWRFDVIEWLGGGPDVLPAVRQSQLFRARKLLMASLRSLLPVRRVSQSARLQREFRECQQQLAYEEWVTAGEASLFRRVAFRSAKGTPFRGAKGDSERPWLHLPPDLPDRSAWDECVTHYLAGRLNAAIPPDNADGHYAAAMMALELGDIPRAIAELTAVKQTATDGPLAILADDWLRQMESLQP